jgi:hypothetical protein
VFFGIVIFREGVMAITEIKEITVLTMSVPCSLVLWRALRWGIFKKFQL